MKRTLLILSLAGISVLPAVAQPLPKGPTELRISQTSQADKKFEGLASRFLEDFLRLNPESATILGDHRFDAQWSDMSPAGMARLRDFYAQTLARVNGLNLAELQPANRVDAEILKTNAEAALFTLDELKEYQWNPLIYNPGPGLFALLARDYGPLDQRLEALASRLRGIEQLVAAARVNLKNPPRIHTETAIGQNKGVLAWLKSDLDGQLPKDSTARPALREARDQAVKSMEAYQEWLEKDLLPRSKGQFRLGATLYRKKLAFTLESDFTAEEIMARAQRDLKVTHAEMTSVARSLYPQLFGQEPGQLTSRELCKAVLDRLAEQHPDNTTILQQAREDLVRASRFVESERLMSVPPEECKVIEMPEFNRGVAVAYCDSPGPLEKKGETFYAIAPTPTDWTAERVESFYREYNFAMLDNLTVHEAMPGHFLQLMHANRFKAPTRLRSVFQSGTFVEGWATYAEQLMAAHNYGGPQVRMQQLKMRLRLILNSMIDQKIHVGTMSEGACKKLLLEEGFQEEGEAAGKWRRACLTSTQLSTYFVGNCEVNEISHDYAKLHPELSVLQLHDRILSFGSPAPRYIRRLLGLGPAGK